MGRNILIVIAGMAIGIVLLFAVSTDKGISQADVVGIIFFGLGGLLVWRIASAVAEPPDRIWLPRIVVASQILRGTWCLLKHTVLAEFYHRYIEWEDAYGRHFAALREARAWHYGLGHPQLPATLSQAHGYMVQLKTSVLYYLFGPSPLLPEALVATGTVSICIAVYIAAVVGKLPRGAIRLPVILSAFLPSLIFWHTLDNKDGVTATCAAWSLVGLLWLFEGGARSGIGLLLLIGMDALAIVYRPYVGFLLVTGQGLAWAYTVKLPKTALGTVARVWIFLLFAPVVLWIGAKEMKETYGERMGLQWAVEQYGAFRESGLRGGIRGSEYIIPLEASTPAQAILQLPIRIFLILFSPIPIWPGTFRRMLMYPQMWFLYLYVLPRLVLRIGRALKERPMWALTIILTVAPVVVAYALKTAVSGEAARMRTQFISELFIFAGIGDMLIEQRKMARLRTFSAAATGR